MDRRDLLRVAARSLLTLPAIILAVPAAGYLAHSGLRKEKLADKASLGKLAELSNEPSRKVIKAAIPDAWVKKEKSIVIWARLDDSGEPVALSASCPHQRCPVNWDKQKELYICPCHGSSFGVDGAWISGPSEQPLKRLSVTNVAGELLIQVQELISD